MKGGVIPSWFAAHALQNCTLPPMNCIFACYDGCSVRVWRAIWSTDKLGGLLAAGKLLKLPVWAPRKHVMARAVVVTIYACIKDVQSILRCRELECCYICVRANA